MERLGQTGNGKFPTVTEWTDPRRAFKSGTTILALHLEWIRAANVKPLRGVPQILEAVDIADILCTVVMPEDGCRMRVSGSRQSPIYLFSELIAQGLVTTVRSLKSHMVFSEIANPVPETEVGDPHEESTGKEAD